jgi:hypothetical protein
MRLNGEVPMAELITGRVAVSGLWIPTAWAKSGLTEEEIEMAVAHAIADGKDEFSLKNKEGIRFWFDMKDEPLEFQSESHEAVIEVNVFTLRTMVRHFVSITVVE